MHYVGLDLGWSVSVICVLDENGRKLLSRQIRGSWEKVFAEVGKVKKPFSVCFEASTGYGYVYEKLSGMAKQVLVAHPGQLRLIFKSKRKNDRVDAEKLAKLLYLGEVPTVWVPDVDVRCWRGMIEYRIRLVQKRTRAKNALRALLRSHGIRPPRGLWTRKGTAWLKGLEFANSFDTMRRDMLLEEVAEQGDRVKRVEKELSRVAKRHPGVALLRTIPGVGPRTAEAVVAYIADAGRFSSNRSIGCYFGIVPCQDASAGQNRLGHITKEGPGSVRGLVVEATWQAVRRSPSVRRRFERIVKGDPKRRKLALVAVAHYLFRAMLAMLRTGEVWREEAA